MSDDTKPVLDARAVPIIDARTALAIAQEDSQAKHQAWRESLEAVRETEEAVRLAEEAALESLGITKDV